MAKTYLEINTVNHNFDKDGYEKVSAELNRELDYQRRQILQLSSMMDSADAQTQAGFAKEVEQFRSKLEQIRYNRELLEKYPDEFPALYAMRNRVSEDGASLEFRETLNDESEIVTEARDVLPKDDRLELVCTLEGTGSFGLSLEAYDKAGEDNHQLKARINFSQKALEDLNAARLKQILEFCERRGLSVYDIDLPMKDGVIDVDEKLASLTKQFVEERSKEAEQQNSPEIETVTKKDFNLLDVKAVEAPVADLDIQAPKKIAEQKKKESKKEKTLDGIHDDLIEMLEKDMHKTRGLSYFEHLRRIDGLSTYVFSLYDKPSKDNEKKDGLKDKNGVYVPTYAYRLYVSQDPDSGRFVFGYATPGGKKMDDVMAGDYLGIVKKTGVTHVNFSDLSSLDKGVWMMACAEKGLVPIGISINMAKAKTMVEAARKKLSSEEFMIFKRNLADQMLENAAKKCKDKNDRKFGLPESEFDYINNLKADFDFDNFRRAYDDENGLYNEVLKDIERGGKDKETGAATTFGAMRTLRTVFDIYEKYQYKTFGDFLKDERLEQLKVTPEERAKLNSISENKMFTEFGTSDFMLLYRTLLPHQIENAKKDILEAYRRETKRNGPKRADNVVLSSDLFPGAKGAVNEINIILRRKGIEALTLPTEHNGLDFARPQGFDAALEAEKAAKNPTREAASSVPVKNAREAR